MQNRYKLIILIFSSLCIFNCHENSSNAPLAEIIPEQIQLGHDTKNPVKLLGGIESTKRKQLIKSFVQDTSLEDLKSKLTETDEKTGENLAHKIFEDIDFEVSVCTKVFQANAEIFEQKDKKNQSPIERLAESMVTQTFNNIRSAAALEPLAAKLNDVYIDRQVKKDPYYGDIDKLSNIKLNAGSKKFEYVTNTGLKISDLFVGNQAYQSIFQTIKAIDTASNAEKRDFIEKLLKSKENNTTLLRDLYNYLTSAMDPSAAQMRKEFLKKPIVPVTMSLLVETDFSQIFYNTSPSYGRVPKTTFLKDYPLKGAVDMFPPGLVVKLEASFESKLPKGINDETNKFNLKGKVDIFLLVQGLKNLGERGDHVGKKSSEYTTRLHAHAWIQPNTPKDFPGAVFNRDLFFGVFEPEDSNIGSYEVKINTMRHFNVHLHDSALSPRTAGVKINTNNTQSFWSLVIDDKNTVREKIRANATFHILLDDEDQDTFMVNFVENDELTNVGDLMNKFNTNPNFKNKLFVAKLNELFR